MAYALPPGAGPMTPMGMKSGSRRKDRTADVGSVKMVYRGGRGSHLDDECASPFSDDSGLRSATSIIEEGAIRWSISLVWTCQ